MAIREIFKIIFLSLSLVFIGCSDNAFDKPKSKNHLPTGMTRALNIGYPTRSDILSELESKMKEVWELTKADALKRQNREYGFTIYMDNLGNPKASSTKKGEIIENPTDEVSIELDLVPNYCGAFHTHVPLTTFPSGYSRDVGASSNDITTANTYKIPAFVYDYTKSPLRSGHSINESAKIYSYGKYNQRPQ